MFPYAMLATLPLFCSVDWPRKIICKLPKYLQLLAPKASDIQPSSHCVYDKEDIKPEGDKKVGMMYDIVNCHIHQPICEDPG
jgi:vitamin K-dependent gamma-carboxylase